MPALKIHKKPATPEEDQSETEPTQATPEDVHTDGDDTQSAIEENNEEPPKEPESTDVAEPEET